jgi:uncharacterized membrane-anchored protein YhcB (DUF1043 family)
MVNRSYYETPTLERTAMASEGVVVGVVVGTVVGVVAAHIGTKVIRKVTEDLHQEELREAKVDSFWEGWSAASTNVENIRKRYEELDLPEEKGANFK